MPYRRAKRRRRHAKIRLFRVVVKGLTCQWTLSHADPYAALGLWLEAAQWVFRSCIRKTSTRPHDDFRVARCLALIACGLSPPVASTFQQGCLQAFSGALDWCGLNSRQINYLQRSASETHYRGSIRQGETPCQVACPPHFYTRPGQVMVRAGSASAHCVCHR